MPQSHLRRSPEILVCDAEQARKSEVLASDWPGHGRCLDAGDCPVDISKENNLELFSPDDLWWILHLWGMFDTPIRDLSVPFQAPLDICEPAAGFFQVRRLENDWRVSFQAPQDAWKIFASLSKNCSDISRWPKGYPPMPSQALDDACFKNPLNNLRCSSYHWRIMWPLRRCVKNM